MTDFESIARAETRAVLDEAARIADTDAALRAVLAGDPTVLTPLHERPGRRRGGVLALSAAAAAVVVVSGVLVVWPRERETSVVDVPATTSAVAPTVAPSVAVLPPTTVAPITATPTTITPTSAATTTLPALVGAAGMASWPEAPVSVPTLDDVPLMLPTVEIPGATSAVRWEWIEHEPSVSSAFHQSWLAGDGSARALQIMTRLGVQPTEGRATADVDVAGWSRASFVSSSPPLRSLELVDAAGYVAISAVGLSDEQLVDVATSLARRPGGGPGWVVGALPPGLTSVREAWHEMVASRHVRWHGADGNLEAELWISPAGVVDIEASTAWGHPTTFADVNGTQAVVVDLSGIAAVVWSPTDDVVVRIGARGGPDAALAIARSLQGVDPSTWEAASVVDPFSGDGCDSFFC